MWRPKIAAPTFLFREQAPRELPVILRRYAEIGFDGVEFAGFFGWDGKEIGSMLREYGLQPAGDNLPLYDIMEHMEEVLAIHRELGFYSLTAGNLREEHLPGGAYFAETVEWLGKLGKACREQGLRLLYHNHAFEVCRRVGEKRLLEALMEAVPAELLGLQPDLGWMQIGGGDPIFYLRAYRDRCPVIHVKDFFATDREKIGDPFDLKGQRGGEDRGFFEFRPTGYGISNIPAQLPYIRACAPAWLVTCQDCGYERDAFVDLELGLRYLKELLRVQGPGGAEV